MFRTLARFAPVRSRIPRTPPPFPKLRRQEKGQFGASSEFAAGVSPSLLHMLSEPILVIERHLELMNVFLGFEQTNKYTIYKPSGEIIGFMEETDLSITRGILRQFTKLHRPFTVDLFDVSGQHALTIRRPFSFINSHIRCLLPGAEWDDPNGGVLGESQQEWHLWRRRYNLYEANGEDMDQFGRIDAPFLSFSFPVANEQGALLSAIDRNWVGLGREMFTDTGVYVIRNTPEAVADMYPDSPLAGDTLSLRDRAVMLANAVSIDFDYFSRHSNRGVGFAEDY